VITDDELQAQKRKLFGEPEVVKVDRWLRDRPARDIGKSVGSTLGRGTHGRASQRVALAELLQGELALQRVYIWWYSPLRHDVLAGQ
jgi:hypothetical protein